MRRNARSQAIALFLATAFSLAPAAGGAVAQAPGVAGEHLAPRPAGSPPDHPARLSNPRLQPSDTVAREPIEGERLGGGFDPLGLARRRSVSETPTSAGAGGGPIGGRHLGGDFDPLGFGPF